MFARSCKLPIVRQIFARLLHRLVIHHQHQTLQFVNKDFWEKVKPPLGPVNHKLWKCYWNKWDSQEISYLCRLLLHQKNSARICCSKKNEWSRTYWAFALIFELVVSFSFFSCCHEFDVLSFHDLEPCCSACSCVYLNNFPAGVV